jgi:hypothetical protein
MTKETRSVCHAVLQDPNFLALLERADEEHAAAVQAAGCCCGGRLHSARYPRKPRGEPRCRDGAVTRHSFCCAQCRRRRTPMSVRFLGRRVYWAALVLLATALAHGFSDRRLAQLKELLGVPARTLLRWRHWWLREFIVTPLWIAQRGRFVPPPPESALLPASLLERFTAPDEPSRLFAALQFIAPLSTNAEGR